MPLLKKEEEESVYGGSSLRERRASGTVLKCLFLHWQALVKRRREKENEPPPGRVDSGIGMEWKAGNAEYTTRVCACKSGGVRTLYGGVLNCSVGMQVTFSDVFAEFLVEASADCSAWT